jgi:hypothetical protein
MSARLNLNPIKYTSWKGQVFYQVSSFLKENQNNSSGLTTNQLMRSMPLKIYRKEIVSHVPKPCNLRSSVKIEELDRPGSTIVSETTPCSNGLVNIKTNDIYECESKNCNINMPDYDARRRVRSAGMIRKKYNPSKNNDTYCTSSNQYLVSRNRTFAQNQYNYIRQGNSNVKPGSALSKSNLYSPNGISHCVQPYISSENNNNTFSYTWLNGNTYTVTLPESQYDINQMNTIFQNTMYDNTHYFINQATESNHYLLNMTYDNQNNTVILQTYSKDLYTNGEYTIPPLSTWEISSNNVPVAFVIPNTNFQNIIGFSAGTYAAPSQSSNITPHITTNYVTMNYKPNNPQFGQQGAVSSSTLVSRKRYDTITKVGNNMKSAYGSATANALAYGVSDHQYTLKDRIGFPLKKTPVISKYTGEIKCVNSLAIQKCK